MMPACYTLTVWEKLAILLMTQSDTIVPPEPRSVAAQSLWVAFPLACRPTQVSNLSKNSGKSRLGPRSLNWEASYGFEC